MCAQRTFSGGIDGVIQQTLSIISLKKEPVKKRNVQLKKLVEELVVIMKKDDPLFEKLFEEIHWTGRFYEGTKISKPDEFDLNFSLRLPGQENNIGITPRGLPPGTVGIYNLKNVLNQIKVSASNADWSAYQKMELWCDSQGLLLPSRVRDWFKALVVKAIFSHHHRLADQINRLGLTNLTVEQNGPAVTLVTDQVSIDMVSGIVFRENLPPSPFRGLSKPPLAWFAVPKPQKGPGSEVAWRVSCTKHEQRLLKDPQQPQHVKPTIRLIKKLRDTQKWDELHSYLIKSSVFWDLEERSVQWDLGLFDVFITCLEHLQRRLEQNQLQFYWDPRLGLLDDMADTERRTLAANMRHVINRIKVDVQANPANVGRIIAP